MFDAFVLLVIFGVAFVIISALGFKPSCGGYVPNQHSNGIPPRSNSTKSE